MTYEPIEVTRQDRIYCLKAGSDYHSEVCEECRFYPNCDHMTQDDMTELTIKDLEALAQEPKIGHWINRHIIANTSIDMIVCSECGEEFSYDAETGISEYSYCPNCGARMSESKFFAKVAESYCKGLRDGLTAESEE